jgi:diacylglycerol kinase (ATP)
MDSTKVPVPVQGIKRVWKALFYSLSGFQLAYRDEAAFRQELFLVVILTVVCILLPLEAWLKVSIMLSHGLVLITELLNTAIEAIVDKASPEFSEDAKKAKDTASAAVLLSLILAGGIWLYAVVMFGFS